MEQQLKKIHSHLQDRSKKFFQQSQREIEWKHELKQRLELRSLFKTREAWLVFYNWYRFDGMTSEGVLMTQYSELTTYYNPFCQDIDDNGEDLILDHLCIVITPDVANDLERNGFQIVQKPSTIFNCCWCLPFVYPEYELHLPNFKKLD